MTSSTRRRSVWIGIIAIVPITFAGAAAPALATPIVDCDSLTISHTADSLTVSGSFDLPDGDDNGNVVLYLDQSGDDGDALDVAFVGDGPLVDAPFSLAASSIGAGSHVPIVDFYHATNLPDDFTECTYPAISFGATTPDPQANDFVTISNVVIAQSGNDVSVDFDYAPHAILGLIQAGVSDFPDESNDAARAVLDDDVNGPVVKAVTGHYSYVFEAVAGGTHHVGILVERSEDDPGYAYLSADFTLPAAGPDEPSAELSQTTVGPGGTVTVDGSGFEPGESIEIWLHSTPVLLFSGVASAGGLVHQNVIIPAGTAAGAHQIQLVGAISGSTSINLTVLALAATGVDIAFPVTAAGVLLLGGLALLLVRRRQKQRRAQL